MLQQNSGIATMCSCTHSTLLPRLMCMLGVTACLLAHAVWVSAIVVRLRLNSVVDLAVPAGTGPVGVTLWRYNQCGREAIGNPMALTSASSADIT
jgi:hypothetical protein